MTLQAYKTDVERVYYLDDKGSGLIMYADKVGNGFQARRVLTAGGLTSAARIARTDLLLNEGAQIKDSDTGFTWEVKSGAWARSTSDLTEALGSGALIPGALHSFKKVTGAVGDGVTVDNAAVGIAVTSNNINYFVEAGTYLLTVEQVMTAQNLSFTATPGTVTFLMPSSVATSQHILRIASAQNVSFFGIKFQSQQVGAADDVYGLVYGNNFTIDGLSFERCEFTAPTWNTNGIKLINEGSNITRRVFVTRCKFYDLGRMGLEAQNHEDGYLLPRFSQITVRDCEFSNLGLGNTSASTTTGATVTSGVTTINFSAVPASTNSGVIWAGAHSFAILSQTATTVTVAGDQTARFTNGVVCKFLGGYGMGVSLSGIGTNATVSDNTFDGCQNGAIELVGSSNFTLSNNRFRELRGTITIPNPGSIKLEPSMIVNVITGAAGVVTVWGNKTALCTAGVKVLIAGQVQTIASSATSTAGTYGPITTIVLDSVPAFATPARICDAITCSSSRQMSAVKINDNVCEHELRGDVKLWNMTAPRTSGNTFLLAGYLYLRNTSGLRSSQDYVDSSGAHAMFVEGTSDLNDCIGSTFDLSRSVNPSATVRTYGAGATRQRLLGCRIRQSYLYAGTYADNAAGAPPIELRECWVDYGGSGVWHRTRNRLMKVIAASGAGSLTLDSYTVATGGADGHVITLTGNATIASIDLQWAPLATGEYSGQTHTVVYIQDATGGRVPTFGANIIHPAGWSNTGNTANKRCVVTYVHDGTNMVAQGANSWA